MLKAGKQIAIHICDTGDEVVYICDTGAEVIHLIELGAQQRTQQQRTEKTQELVIKPKIQKLL